MTMTTNFFKYQGAGNDFIMIDDRGQNFQVKQDQIASLCDRRFGIGADGLILLRNAPGYDFRMVYFNADGAEGSMCGNGGRCAVRFAQDLGLVDDYTHFIAVDGEHTAQLNEELVRLKMGNVDYIETVEEHFYTNTGSPHYVAFVNSVDETDVVGIGKAVRYGPIYGPEGGVNVNFVQVLEKDFLKVRTYERGVEDETLACGTGVTACALVAAESLDWKGPVTVRVPGGMLSVEFKKGETPGSFHDIHLIGPAEFVFQGTI